ncbi:MAG: hypothetical protein ACPHRO_13380 [Nannocystaceae bacterium]
MDLKKFSRTYDLDLIPASHDRLHVGMLVWDPLIGRPKFDHPGMPDTIFAAFRDADYVDDAGMLGMIEEARTVDKGKASLAAAEVEFEREHSSALEHPVLGKIEGGFDLSRVRKFKFADLEVRVMSPLMRVQIDDHLEELKRDRWEDYDGRIRRVFMITELYYGSLNMIVASKAAAEFDAALSQLNVPVASKISGSRNAQYAFDHADCPFAMRLERVR